MLFYTEIITTTHDPPPMVNFITNKKNHNLIILRYMKGTKLFQKYFN